MQEASASEVIQAATSVRTTSSLISLLLVVASVTLSTAGHVTLKTAMDRVGRIGAEEASAPMQTITRATKEPLLWFGLALFGVSAVFWLVVLSRVALSLAFPFVGLSYVAIVVLDAFVRHEDVPGLRWVGAAIIGVGIGLIGISSRTVAG